MAMDMATVYLRGIFTGFDLGAFPEYQFLFNPWFSKSYSFPGENSKSDPTRDSEAARVFWPKRKTHLCKNFSTYDIFERKPFVHREILKQSVAKVTKVASSNFNSYIVDENFRHAIVGQGQNFKVFKVFYRNAEITSNAAQMSPTKSIQGSLVRQWDEKQKI